MSTTLFESLTRFIHAVQELVDGEGERRKALRKKTKKQHAYFRPRLLI